VSGTRDDTRTRVAGGTAFGAAAAAATGSTPIGVAVVAGLGGLLTWRLLRRRRDGQAPGTPAGR
jgi:hypothetical protein